MGFCGILRWGSGQLREVLFTAMERREGENVLNLAPAFPVRQKLQRLGRLEELEEEEGRTARHEEMSRRWRLPGSGHRQGKP